MAVKTRTTYAFWWNNQHLRNSSQYNETLDPFKWNRVYPLIVTSTLSNACLLNVYYSHRKIYNIQLSFCIKNLEPVLTLVIQLYWIIPDKFSSQISLTLPSFFQLEIKGRHEGDRIPTIDLRCKEAPRSQSKREAKRTE